MISLLFINAVSHLVNLPGKKKVPEKATERNDDSIFRILTKNNHLVPYIQ